MKIFFLKKIFRMIYEIIYLLKLEDTKIFLHQNLLVKIIPIKLFSNIFFRKILLNVLIKISKKNKLIIEVNDLIYEQSIDLELLNDHQRKLALKFQKKLFGLKNIQYIFAAEEMKKYCINNYGVLEKNSYICINGGITLVKKNKDSKLERKVKCVYAGTLNKGRQIEKLIEIFENETYNYKLLLIGIGGEWILEKKYKNVEYLGSYTEEKALEIVANCDIGLVPYDSTRLYYNLCYPTKNSFYISAVVPLLVTPMKETLNQLNEYDILFVEDLENWSNVLNGLSLEEIQEKKKNVEKIKDKFTWNYLITECFFKMKLGV